MTDPENPKAPVQVVMAPLPWQTELWQMLKKQGFVALILIAAVYGLWGQWQADRMAWENRQLERDKLHAETAKRLAEEATIAVDKMAAHQTQQLKDQSEVFRAEQDRTERILGGKINVLGNNVNQNKQLVEQAIQKVNSLNAMP